ncbi:UDP-N-acetylmuramate dehydrogenase [Ponticaulis sp.]|uniref:UDP-N-acetylmuramate dehydrogenase n=1 Tax=Ponticaulis sp. TaxID=2020902 RepID=UPI000B66F907|nr:UDP-N-acetylmuramate dehydrogenase [Ponticaulis sp.]MAI89005.1 UDP-N-acetylenolpyruvoylglucosamine reductase [Ponticaulis sp.]OUY01687.1 MAG: UDP-N-acetylenolpyruvoylglucosamine reductase [Hyphomonadaceae bacterium TMED5]
MELKAEDFKVRGKLIENAPLAPYTWFRVGGPADLLFLPADEDDLCDFLKALPEDVPVTVLGVGSNLIVRDGGIEGVVIRLMGKYWGAIEAVNGLNLLVGAGALDLSVARFAAKEGIAGLSFLSGIPGSIGGNIRTNAGCYGRELKDVLNQVETVNRRGEKRVFQGGLVDYDLPEIGFSYRHTDFSQDLIVTRVLIAGDDRGDPETLAREIEEHQARRAETQPIKEKTSGSTFANPDPPGTPNQRSAWKLIDAAGCRGLRVGGAQVSEKHCNFLINTGDARASDLEALGELVRARVLETSGVDLRWEVRRIGRI